MQRTSLAPRLARLFLFGSWFLSSPLFASSDPRCSAPGPQVLADAAGDQVGNPDTDIISESISETITTQANLVFTVKMASLQSLTNNARRIFTFKTTGATPKDYYVAMISSAESSTPVFVYGTGVNGFGTSSDKLGNGLPGSGYKADGTFTVVAPISAFSLNPGDTINTFAGVVRLSGGSCNVACVNGAAADTATAPAANGYTLTTAAESCGTPPPLDSDGDGVNDASDNCPNTPAGTTVDAAGCPVVAGDAATCAVPGKTLLTDASGDTANGTAGTDLKSLQLSQPKQDPDSPSIDNQMLVFQINTDPGIKPSPAYYWFASFITPNGPMGVRMIGDTTGNPIFQTYAVSADTNNNTNGEFAASTSPADSRSTYNSTAGTITIWAKATTFGLQLPGDQLQNFDAGVIQIIATPVASASNTEDGMPSDSGGNVKRSNVSYTLHDNTICGGSALQPPSPPGAASGIAPRFYDVQSPTGLADSAGEPTVGYNPATNAAMIIAGTEVDRITFAEHSTARDAAGNALPESCPATWQDKSYAGAARTLDPILETYQPKGRTFQSSLTGANSIFAYSDDDGTNWTPGQAGPPNGGADHQTVGAGPWAAGAKPASATQDYAVFYCSQSVAAAFCARSDNGGVTFGPGIPFRNSATDCNNAVGGLHGHVQVSRKDGSVFVPFGNCSDKVAVSVSKDSGTNWKVKKVGPSVSGGHDPGLGIASDGTDYLCYAAGDKGKVMATVSRDDGDTWTEPIDIGAPLGIKHTVFTTAVAGDGDRAACAFIGTTTDGNPGSVDFPGIWYPYVATTYDRGKSWHVVNVSGGDPVQGAGGICTDGTTCGSNRNLLDFNDVIMTEQGRVLFGYSDGCRGACVGDPANKSKNGYANNGVVARQSGGRTLLAAFDDKPALQFNSSVVVAPGAACARDDLSFRTTAGSTVKWNAGDTGGGPISNYKIYRGETASGPWTFLADTGPASSYQDNTTLDTVEKYYYKVTAENEAGAALDSNVIELPITLTGLETSCELPGITVGHESTPGDCSTACTPQQDVQRIQVAETPDKPDTVTFTVKVASLSPAPEPGNYYFLMTKKVTGENIYFGMDTSQGTPRYRYGTYAVGTLTSFTDQGAITGDALPDGTIYLYVPKTMFGTPTLKTGDTIVGIQARTRSGSSQGTSLDAIVGDDYTLRGTDICVEPPVVLASLDASVVEGKAPLDVTFTISGTPSTNQTLASYSLMFGDEEGPTATPYVGTFGGQPSVQVPHRYLKDGVYRAQLTVKDTAGLSSANLAEKTIEVGVGDPKAATGASNNRLGGAFPTSVSLALGLLALLAGRRRKAGLR